MMLSGGYCRMMVLQKAPDLRERFQILNLRIGEVRDSNSGTLVEFMIFIQRRRDTCRSLCDRLAIDQQLQIVHPSSTCSGDQEPESELGALGYYWNPDRILAPIPGAGQIESL